MAAPIAPVAAIALRYAAIAAGAFILARALPRRPADPRIDAAMDDLPDGLALSSRDGTSRAAFRWRRGLYLGRSGLRLDAALLARLRVARA